METVMKVLYGPIQPFIWHPERAYFVAMGFAILWAVSVWHSEKFRRRIHVSMLSATLLWVLFGLNEYQAKAAGWNIRVDILLSWPVLFAISVASAWLGIQEFVARKTCHWSVDKSTETK